MKHFNKLLLTLIALFSVQLVNAQCNANFTYQGSDPSFTFIANVTPPASSIYFYDFGDGNTASTAIAPHTYSANGTYYVSFTVIDSVNACSDVKRDTIIVSNASNSGCDASFTYSDSNGTYYFTPTNPMRGYTYNWDINGTLYTTQNVVHTFTSSGYFQACLIVDSNALSCADTSCVYIQVSVGGSSVCDASYSTSNTGADYTFSPDYPDASATYIWDFGDGNSSTSNNPTHTYAASGTYNVSVARVIPSLCVDSAFSTVTVTIITPPVSGTISGTVFMGGLVSDYGVAFLITNDSNGFLTAVDTAIIDSSGMYFFNNVAFGTYLVKAALSPSSANYTSYLPTYYWGYGSGNQLGGKLLWSDATDIILTSVSNGNDISLVAGTNTGGPGFIGGAVSQGANKVGDPISDIHIMVTDASGSPVAYAYSDNAGNFNITNLPVGTYTVYPEIAGKATTPIDVVLTSSKPGTDKIRVDVNSTTVIATIATGIINAPQFTEVRIYPNPVINSLKVDLGSQLSGTVIIQIMDVTGKVLSSENVNSVGVSNINTANLNSGLYILSVENNGDTAIYKFIK